MNPFVKILAWIAIAILGWIGVKMVLGTVTGLIALVLTVVVFGFKLMLLGAIAYAIMRLYKRVRSEPS